MLRFWPQGLCLDYCNKVLDTRWPSRWGRRGRLDSLVVKWYAVFSIILHHIVLASVAWHQGFLVRLAASRVVFVSSVEPPRLDRVPAPAISAPATSTGEPTSRDGLQCRTVWDRRDVGTRLWCRSERLRPPARRSPSMPLVWLPCLDRGDLSAGVGRCRCGCRCDRTNCQVRVEPWRTRPQWRCPRSSGCPRCWCKGCHRAAGPHRHLRRYCQEPDQCFWRCRPQSSFVAVTTARIVRLVDEAAWMRGRGYIVEHCWSPNVQSYPQSQLMLPLHRAMVCRECTYLKQHLERTFLESCEVVDGLMVEWHIRRILIASPPWSMEMYSRCRYHSSKSAVSALRFFVCGIFLFQTGTFWVESPSELHHQEGERLRTRFLLGRKEGTSLIRAMPKNGQGDISHDQLSRR